MAAALTAIPARALEVGVCQTVTLPPPVVRELRARYSDWKIVTPGLLDAADSKTWTNSYPNQCPGVIGARLRTTEQIDFVVNLVKGQQQRAVAFLAGPKVYRRVVLFSYDRGGGPLRLLYKSGPGPYETPEGDRRPLVATDTACFAQLEANATCYYWDGTAFQSIVVSE